MDALFEDPNAEEPYTHLWQTIQSVFRNGLDYRQGNPIKGIVRHLKNTIEVYHNKFFDEQDEMLGMGSYKKKKKKD